MCINRVSKLCRTVLFINGAEEDRIQTFLCPWPYAVVLRDVLAIVEQVLGLSTPVCTGHSVEAPALCLRPAGVAELQLEGKEESPAASGC